LTTTTFCAVCTSAAKRPGARTEARTCTGECGMPKTYKGLTAEDWRAKATESVKRRQESWERSDTDGFMSQWASDMMAQEYRLCADLAEAGGLMETTALFDAETGELASTHLHDGQYGLSWVLNDRAAEKAGKRFVSESKAATTEKRHAAMVKKGFTVGLVRVKGYVAQRGANVTSVRAYTLPDLDALKAGEFEVVTTDVGPEDRRN